MKHFFIFSFFLFFISPLAAQQDWANYGRYEEANGSVTERPEVVFIGNSIIEGWVNARPEYFQTNNFVGRGIGGQVTAQTLARFRADVLELKPEAVVIMVGTNDVAQNQGYVAEKHIAQNVVSMAELAVYNGLKVYVCSILPAAEYPWRREITDVYGKIKRVNELVKNGLPEEAVYVDMAAEMADITDDSGNLPREIAHDGIHPTPAGYELMERILEKYGL